MSKITITSFILVCFFHLSSVGQIESKLLSPKKMQKDLKTLLQTIEAHPAPYAHISEEQFSSLVKEVEQRCTQEMDEIDFYKNVSEIVAALGDGHSSVYMPKDWLHDLRKKHGVFPYEVYLTNDNKLYVTKSYGDQQLTLGRQISHLNGMAVDAFIAEIDPYLSYETIPFRNNLISETFESLLYLVFREVNNLAVQLKGEEAPYVIPTQDYKEWKKQKKDMTEDIDDKVAKGITYDFNILKEGVAKIDIFSFQVNDFSKYKFFLRKTFRKIREENIHSLIIDVRGNYGGWPKVSSELLHYLHEGYFKTMAKSSMKVSFPHQTYFEDRYAKIRYNVAHYKRPNHHAVNLQSLFSEELGTLVHEADYYNEEPLTKKDEFAGDCYLLVDRKSYSASSCFASTFQCYSLGLVIGEPTGGTRIFSAQAIPVSLYRSGFTVMMSTTLNYAPCYNLDNEPVKPNIEVVPSMIDRVHNLDPQLNTTLLLIKKMQAKKAALESK